MAQVTIEIPEENIGLLLEVTEAMGINKKDIFIKSEIQEWHKQVLQKRLEDYQAGSAKASSWDEFVKELAAEDEE